MIRVGHTSVSSAFPIMDETSLELDATVPFARGKKNSTSIIEINLTRPQTLLLLTICSEAISQNFWSCLSDFRYNKVAAVQTFIAASIVVQSLVKSTTSTLHCVRVDGHIIL